MIALSTDFPSSTMGRISISVSWHQTFDDLWHWSFDSYVNDAIWRLKIKCAVTHSNKTRYFREFIKYSLVFALKIPLVILCRNSCSGSLLSVAERYTAGKWILYVYLNNAIKIQPVVMCLEIETIQTRKLSFRKLEQISGSTKQRICQSLSIIRLNFEPFSISLFL